jgi:hypothetical protein
MPHEAYQLKNRLYSSPSHCVFCVVIMAVLPAHMQWRRVDEVLGGADTTVATHLHTA